MGEQGITTDGVGGSAPRRRGRGTLRDLAISLGVLVVPLVALVAFCQPNGADAPDVDADRVYVAARAENAFPVREPGDVVERREWKATAASFRPAGSGRFTLRVSYSIPAGGYLQLVQSNRDPEVLVPDLVDRGQPEGVLSVDGARWDRYTAADGAETAYVLLTPEATYVVVGDAPAEAARALIESLGR